MAFKPVTALDADVTYSLGKLNKKTGKTDPKQAEGYYLGNREVEGGKFGKSVLHFLQTAKGNLGVWGSGDMNKKLAGVIPGEMVRITANGTKPTPRGDMKVFNVEVDKDNTIEVSAVQATVLDQSDDEETTDENSDYNGGYDEDNSQNEALAAAERAAKVQALLNKNRKVASK